MCVGCSRSGPPPSPWWMSNRYIDLIKTVCLHTSTRRCTGSLLQVYQRSGGPQRSPRVTRLTRPACTACFNYLLFHVLAKTQCSSGRPAVFVFLSPLPPTLPLLLVVVPVPSRHVLPGRLRTKGHRHGGGAVRARCWNIA